MPYQVKQKRSQGTTLDGMKDNRNMPGKAGMNRGESVDPGLDTSPNKNKGSVEEHQQKRSSDSHYQDAKKRDDKKDDKQLVDE